MSSYQQSHDMQNGFSRGHVGRGRRIYPPARNAVLIDGVLVLDESSSRQNRRQLSPNSGNRESQGYLTRPYFAGFGPLVAPRLWRDNGYLTETLPYSARPNQSLPRVHIPQSSQRMTRHGVFLGNGWIAARVINQDLMNMD